jgi:hypothetical protein
MMLAAPCPDPALLDSNSYGVHPYPLASRTKPTFEDSQLPDSFANRLVRVSDATKDWQWSYLPEARDNRHRQLVWPVGDLRNVEANSGNEGQKGARERERERDVFVYI